MSTPIASEYSNADIAPIPLDARHWGMKDMLALWVAMAACIPTYMLASSMINEGMNWWQAVLTIFLGNVIVLIPIVLNAHAGTKYGIPFPVYCRASFGVRGANLPAMLRALVACGWFGIQTWLGGSAVFKILQIYIPAWQQPELLPALGISLPQLVCFLAFWALTLFIVYRGIDSIRLLLRIKAPLLIVLGLALLAWAYNAANGFGPIFSQPSKFEAGGEKAGLFWGFFLPSLTASVGFWATLSLNIPDFSRYARSQRDQVVGQAIGLPASMGLYSFIGVVVTSATVVIYGRAIWDPVDVLALTENRLAHVVGLLALCLATLATNLAANVVGPANDIANLWPRRISFRMGGIITGVIGVLIQPWRLLADPSGYIFTWLVAYSALLGSVGGILITDYYFLRKTQLDLPALYHKGGPYWYRNGWNLSALFALAAGVAPCVPGFLGTIKAMEVNAFWMDLYSYAWFLSFGLSAAVYGMLSKATHREPV